MEIQIYYIDKFQVKDSRAVFGYTFNFVLLINFPSWGKYYYTICALRYMLANCLESETARDEILPWDCCGAVRCGEGGFECGFSLLLM